MAFKKGWVSLLCFLSASLMAHEDLDIGIEDVTLDSQCHAQITLKNVGRDLPDSFYLTVNPGIFVVRKGELEEQSISLRALDKRKKLHKSGGTLVLQTKNVFAKIADPISVELQFWGEFQDYGAANNKIQKSMDCIVGKGQISGAPVIPTQPDIAVTRARIDPQTCILQLTFTNLTPVPMDESAWDTTIGASITRMDLTTHERMPEIPLVELDPDRQFSRAQNILHWQQKLQSREMDKLRVGMWRVPKDAHFANNQIDMDIPESCRSPR